MRRWSTAVLAAAMLSAAASAQQPEPWRFSAEASAVVLDVVVRDARGRPVPGLTRADFEVFEDRRRQAITVFEAPAARSSDASPAGAAAAAARLAGIPAGSPSVVALVFEQLGPAARRGAVAAAHRLLDTLQPRDFAGVFTVDRAIDTLQDYAPPSEAVRLAVDRAATQAGLPLRRAGFVPGAEFAAASSGQPTQETRDEAKRTRGMATLDALDRLIRGLALLPGRKMVALFSEGIALDVSEETAQITRADGPRPLDDTWLTDGRFERFQRLVEAANAAQVAFYTFDAAGLRVESPFASAGFGRAPYVGLQALAEGTGGAFVENTNDLAPGAVRAAEDQGSYYLLGYTPSKAPDGEYRKLDVRVRCDGCRVLARRGYRAAPGGETRRIGARDVAPFLVLDSGGAASDLPLRVEDLARGPGQTVLLDATLPELSATPGGLVTFLARVLDRDGRATALVSQHFELAAVPRPGVVLRFSRQLPAPPKAGRLEVVVYDHATDRATVSRVPAP